MHRKSLVLMKPGHRRQPATRTHSPPSTCPEEEGPRPPAAMPPWAQPPAAPIPAEAGGHLGRYEGSSTKPSFFQLPSHPAPLTSPSEEPGFGVGKMSLGFSQIQYPLEPKPISLAQGPAIEGLSLLFKPPRAQLL